MLDSLELFYLEGKFIIGLLILIRVSGILASGPFLKSSAIIPQVKVMITILLSVIITASFWQEQPTIDLHPWSIALTAIKEFLVGLILGFSADMIFKAARFAGGIIDTEMGFHTAALFERENNTPSLIGEFKELVALMLFLIINGHHYLIEGIYISLESLPLNTFAITDSTVSILVDIMTMVMVIGVKMASPVLIALFLTNLGLALLARVAPQTNVFILSFQLKVFVGLIVLSITIPAFIMITKGAMADMQDELLKMLISINPQRTP